MYFPEDESIAKYLQNEFNYLQEKKVQSFQSTEKDNQNPVASILEISDPTPSIHDLFVKFDKKFFWSSLGMVQVLWSNRMTTCAGMCRFEGKFGYCRISLSAPLLSFRPRKDLVQTLLHEMIHAYLFVTNNYKDRDDHGTEFHKHMFRINNAAGTNITVYHSFHDEVDYYKQHIWRCNGSCRFKKPYFGFVRRAQNRAPGPNDFWWSKHKSECNGTFIKIAGPEKKIKKLKNPKATKVKTKTKDIRNFVQSISNSKDKSSNIVTFADINETTSTGLKSEAITVVNRKNYDSSEKTNTLRGQKDNSLVENFSKSSNSKLPNSSNKKHRKTNNIDDIPDSVLEEHFSNSKFPCSKNVNGKIKNYDSEKIKETIRNVWCNKFLPKLIEEKVETKKFKLECSTSSNKLINKIENHSNESLVQTKINKEPESSNVELGNLNELKHCLICNEQVLQSEMNEHLENCVNCSFVNSNNLNDDNDDDGGEEEEEEEEEEKKDDDLEKYENVQELEEDKEDEREKNIEIKDIEEIEQENKIECERKKNIESKDIQQIEEENEINCDSVSCPCCGLRYLESEINSHLDECLTLIALKEEAGNL